MVRKACPGAASVADFLRAIGVSFLFAGWLVAQTQPIVPPALPQSETTSPAVAETSPRIQLNSPTRLSGSGQAVSGQAVSGQAVSGQAGAGQASPSQSVPTQPSGQAEVVDTTAVQVLPQTELATIGADLAATIQRRTEQLDADPERTQEVKDAIKTIYKQALVELDNAAKAEKKHQEWLDSANSAPDRLEAAKAAAEQLKNAPPAEQYLQTEVALLGYEEAQSRLRTLAPELAAARATLEKLRLESTTREQRVAGLPQLISELRAKVEASGRSTGTPAAENADPLALEAASFLAQAKSLAAREQLREMESEQRAYAAEATLLPIQIELAKSQEKQLQEQVRAVETRSDELRKGRISGFRIAYQLLPMPSDPTFADIDDQLQHWFGQKTDGQQSETGREIKLTWPELSLRQTALKTDREAAKGELDQWTEVRSTMLARIGEDSDAKQASGVNRWIGLRLRKQRGELPDINIQTARLREHQAEIQESESILFYIEDAVRALEQLQESAAQQSDTALKEKSAMALKILAEIKLDLKAYRNDLYDIADIRESLKRFTKEYRTFIDKRVLWIRSSEPLPQMDMSSVNDAFRWLADLSSWRKLVQLLWRDATRNVFGYLLFAISFGALLANQRRLREKLRDLSDKAKRNTCKNFSFTVQAVGITLLISAMVPVLLLSLSWRIMVATQLEMPAERLVIFCTSAAYGFYVATMTFLPLEVLRQCYRPSGLGASHFEWSSEIMQHMKRNLRWFINFAVPLTVIVGCYSSQPNTRYDATLGRCAFMLLMAVVSVWMATVFSPKLGVFSEHIQKNREGWIDRLSFLWYAAVIIGPLVLAVMSFAGYHYTAEQFAIKLLTSLWMLASLVIVYCLLRRWLLLKRRRLMMENARQRLEAVARGESGENATEDTDLNLVAMNTQTEKLVTSLVFTLGLLGAYLIWGGVIPALEVLDRFALWTVAVEGGEPATITLKNVVLLVPVVVLVVIAVRNVPGLLEIAFLQHLPLTSAAKYAISTLARYVIMGLGIVIVGAVLGLRWTSIQWLVAALGVGLGFGLQEIFANFVSGVILLFEQPIRVGDIITVDGTTGTVTRIRMRATTIVNWDRQELIVPNKNMITGTLLNWTLTDSTNRVVINVGIAYGSDTDQACELIRDVCDQHPNVMQDPGPLITFEGFGDNALNIVLRAYLETMDNRLSTTHQLHQQIYLAFNKAGIEIAFPQRDLHLRSIPDAMAKLLRPDRAVAADSSVHASAIHSN